MAVADLGRIAWSEHVALAVLVVDTPTSVAAGGTRTNVAPLPTASTVILPDCEVRELPIDGSAVPWKEES